LEGLQVNPDLHKRLQKENASVGSSTSKEMVVLDATAFYADVPFSSWETYYSTDSVIEEVSHKKIRKTYIEGLIEAGRLKIYSPSEQYLKKVNNVAKEIGDSSTLSKPDITVVALALEFQKQGNQVMIISDDYSVENLSKTLDIRIVSVMTQGIKKMVKWQKYCSGCGKVFHNGKSRECDVCGSSLKRKFKTANNLSQP